MCVCVCARTRVLMRVHEGKAGDVDLCGCEDYAELNDFNYQTASIEQSQAVVSVRRDSKTHTHIKYIQCSPLLSWIFLS